MSRKNTIIVWKHKDKDGDNSYGHQLILRTEEEANKIASICNNGHKFAVYQTVTLSDEQLKLVMDEKSKTIKENISLDQFNPFSPMFIKHKKELELFKSQKEIFAQGLFLGNSKKPGGQKNLSPLKSALAQNKLFHSAVIERELFSFLEPVDPFKPKTP